MCYENIHNLITENSREADKGLISEISNFCNWLYVQVGSIYSTLALSVERYLAVVHPFTTYRYLGHW